MSHLLLVRDSAGWSRREFPPRDGMPARSAYSCDVYEIDPAMLVVTQGFPATLYADPGAAPPAAIPPGVYEFPSSLAPFNKGGWRPQWDKFVAGIAEGRFRVDSVRWVESDPTTGVGGHLERVPSAPGGPAPGKPAEEGKRPKP